MPQVPAQVSAQAPATSVPTDPERPVGALNRRGRDAFGLPEEVLGAFDKKVAEIERGLSNRDQRLAFRRSANARRFDIHRRIQVHVAGEIRRYDDEVTEGYVGTEVDGAIAAAGDPARVQLGLARASAALTDHAGRNGRPPEWLQGKVADVSTRIHAGVIERLLAQGQDRAAQDYYRETRAAIAGSRQAHLERALEIGSTRGESQRQADRILLEHRDLTEAVAAARKIKDPAVRDATETRVKDYFATAKAAEAEKRTEAFRRAAGVLERSGGNLASMAPGDLALLDPSQRSALETRSRQIREGVEPVTNYETYYGLMSLASADETRGKFLQADLLAHRHELSHRHFEELARLQTSLRSGTKADEVLDGYRTKKQVVDDALASIKIDPTPKHGTKHAEVANNFRKRVDQEVLGLQAQTGKKATSADVQDIVDRLLIQGTIPGSGWFFDDRKRLYELKPGETLAIDVDEIPAAERAKIEDALRRNNRPVNAATIVELFRRKHLRPSALPRPADGAE